MSVFILIYLVWAFILPHTAFCTTPGTYGQMVVNAAIGVLDEANVKLTIDRQRMKLFKALDPDTKTLTLYWSTGSVLAKNENGLHTVSVKFQLMQTNMSCPAFAISSIRLTVIAENGIQTTFGAMIDELDSLLDCQENNLEKTVLLKAVQGLDCVVPEQQSESTNEYRDSNAIPPYLADGHQFSNCHVHCTCMNARIGCVSSCPPSIAFDPRCREVISGSACCKSHECMQTVETDLLRSCRSDLNATMQDVKDAYPPWIALLAPIAENGSMQQQQVTVLDENWIIGAASSIQNAKGILVPQTYKSFYNISSIYVLDVYLDPGTTPEKNLALAKLSEPVFFTGRRLRGVNLPWPALCQAYFEKGCPLNVYPYLAKIEDDEKCSKSTLVNPSKKEVACIKLESSRDMSIDEQKKSIIGTGVISLRSNTIHDLIGIISEQISDNDTASVISLCPYLDWIRSTMQK